MRLILGGARSGKSRYAEALAHKTGKPKLYLATSEHTDAEMSARIARHQADRSEAGWQTREEPLDIVPIITDAAYANHVILVDCLTLWLGNLMHYEKNHDAYIAALREALTTTTAEIILVSNEVGLGIVPESKLARDFRDAAGLLHQRIGEVAQVIILMVAGYPMRVKG